MIAVRPWSEQSEMNSTFRGSFLAGLRIFFTFLQSLPNIPTGDVIRDSRFAIEDVITRQLGLILSVNNVLFLGNSV